MSDKVWGWQITDDGYIIVSPDGVEVYSGDRTGFVLDDVRLRKRLAKVEAVVEKIRKYAEFHVRQCDPFCCAIFLQEVLDMTTESSQ